MSRRAQKPDPSGVPRADDAERAVVGCMWLGREYARDLALRAVPGEFFLPIERQLVACARELAARGEAIDGSALIVRIPPDERGTSRRELAALEEAGLLVRTEKTALQELVKVSEAARHRRLLGQFDRARAVLCNGSDPYEREQAIAEIVAACTPPPSADVLEVLDVAALIESGVPEPTFDLDEFLVRGTLTYLTGPPKGRKTLLALAWSVALVTGRSFCDLKISGEHRILFLGAESPVQIPIQFAKVCAGAAVGTDEVLERVRFVVPKKPLRLENPDHAQALRRAAEEFRATWVIIDSFVRVHGLDENNPGEMAALANTALLPLRDQAGCGVLVLDHPPKPFGGLARAKKEQIRGSWEKLAAADCQIHVETIDAAEGKVSAVSVAASRLVPERDEPLFLRLRVTSGGGLAFEETEEPEAPAKAGRPPTKFHQACNIIANETSRNAGLTFAEAMRFCESAGISRRTAAKSWSEMKPECKVQEVQK